MRCKCRASRRRTVLPAHASLNEAALKRRAAKLLGVKAYLPPQTPGLQTLIPLVKPPQRKYTRSRNIHGEEAVTAGTRSPRLRRARGRQVRLSGRAAPKRMLCREQEQARGEAISSAARAAALRARRRTCTCVASLRPDAVWITMACYINQVMIPGWSHKPQSAAAPTLPVAAKAWGTAAVCAVSV